MFESKSSVPRIVAAAAALSLVTVGMAVSASAAPRTDTVDPTSSEIVTFAATTSGAEQEALLSDVAAVQLSSVPQLHMYAVDVTAAGADALRADPRVESVEADRVRAVEGTPDDPAYGDQWALPKIGWDQAFGTVVPGGTATVAVLDTGVDPSDDLTGKLVPGASMLAGSDTTADPNGHGTAMATIVAAKTDNGVGTAGVAYSGVSVMPVKVLGADGTGQDSDIVAGVVYAADHGADVILMSFSNPGRSDALQAAVDYAWSKGAVLVAATGNDGSSTATYPAGAAKVVGVSATTRDDSLWTSSNSGDDTFLGAPGVDIADGSGSVTGTSASAAIVAGAAALVKANDASASNGVVVGRLARTADPAGSVSDTGNGRVNLARALGDSSTTAVVPQGVAGSGGPFVGPYVVAASALKGALQGQSNPACASPAPCPWQSTSLDGWAELQTIPLRLAFDAGQANSTPNTFTIEIDHASGATAGLESLTGFTPSANVSMGAVTFSTASGGDIWKYTFTASISNDSAGSITFNTKMRAGAHAFSGNSLQIKGAGTLGIFKPAAAPGSPDLQVTKTGPTAVSPGQSMTYTVNYRNLASGSGTTNQATGTQLTDTLPTGVTYVPGSCTGGCVYDSLTNTLTWNVGTVLANSALVSRTFQVTVGTGVNNGTTLTNTAQILSAEDDSNTANNTASAATTVFAALISGQVILDANGNGVFDSGELGLAGATVTLYKDTNSNGSFDGGATDLQVGSPVVTPASGQWAFTSGLVKNTRYFVVRTNPSGYTSTNAVSETVAVGTDHSTAVKDTNDRINVLFDNVDATQYSSDNAFLARVTQQNQTIDFPQPTSPAVYGSSFNVTPSASSGLPVSLVATGGCSITPATPGWTVTMTSGTTSCVLTASQAGDSNWNAATDVVRTVAASKAVLTVTADA
ncbi:S8 family serine peptidase, partial [Nocardioides pocheonensis]